MAVYIITGKLGGGKTLCSVGLIQEAIRVGRKVATNIDLNLEFLLPWRNRTAEVYRLPDRLSFENFEMLPVGNESYDEEKNGLIVLDEGGLSLNSRDYREAGRKEFIRWAIHSRKKGWDLAIIIQHIEGLDKQIRDFFGEHVARCSRMDRLRVPLIGPLLQLIGFKGTFSRLHRVTCRYGQSERDMVTWRKWFRGGDLYACYDTRQQYDFDDTSGVRTMLTPWHLKGRHHKPIDEVRDKLSEIFNRYNTQKVGRLFVFFCAMMLGVYANSTWNGNTPDKMSVVSALSPDANASETSINPANLQEATDSFDPWRTAWISSYIEVPSMDIKKYKFRTLDGALTLPVNWAMAGINKCFALVRSPFETYELTCEQPETEQETEGAPSVSSEVDGIPQTESISSS